MRFSQKKSAEVTRPIKRDCPRPKPEIRQPPKERAERRVQFVAETSEYYRYKHLIVGRLVRLVRHNDFGCTCQFVHDADRKALNHAAGWSDEKNEYMFGNVKFK